MKKIRERESWGNVGIVNQEVCWIIKNEVKATKV